MNQAAAAFLFCTLFMLGNQVRATTLPDACGDDKVQFDVKIAKDQPVPAPPVSDKAQIVFIGVVDAPGCLGCGIFSPRIGVDGSWAGATKGNSYFALSVDPGVHHICADWKSISAARGKNIGVTSFTAEPGHVYFFEVRIADQFEGVSGAPGGAVSTQSQWVLHLSPLSDDEGRYRVKISALATATVKKQ